MVSSIVAAVGQDPSFAWAEMVVSSTQKGFIMPMKVPHGHCQAKVLIRRPFRGSFRFTLSILGQDQHKL